MSIAIVGANQSLEKLCRRALFDFELAFFSGDYEFQRDFDSSKYSLIITFDMAGFHLKTLTNNIWYNLLPLKQLHILTVSKNDLFDYLNKPLSISMFFYTTSEEIKNTLIKKHENIPWIKTFDDWSNSPEKMLLDAVSQLTLDKPSI